MCETETCQQVAQFLDSYMMMMMTFINEGLILCPASTSRLFIQKSIALSILITFYTQQGLRFNTARLTCHTADIFSTVFQNNTDKIQCYETKAECGRSTGTYERKILHKTLLEFSTYQNHLNSLQYLKYYCPRTFPLWQRCYYNARLCIHLYVHMII
jgi:hypothetical protein